MFCKYFLPGCALFFHSLKSVSHRAEVSINSNLSSFSLIDHAIGIVKKSSANQRSCSFSCTFLYFKKFYSFVFYILFSYQFWVNFCVTPAFTLIFFFFFANIDGSWTVWWLGNWHPHNWKSALLLWLPKNLTTDSALLT